MNTQVKEAVQRKRSIMQSIEPPKIKNIPAILVLVVILLSFSGAWAEMPLRKTGDIREMIFDSGIAKNISGTTLLAADRGRIYRKQGKKDLWQPVLSGVKNPLFSISFAGEDNAWISGASGVIIRSSDMGKTWDPQDSTVKKHLFTISFADAEHGCAAGDWGAVVRTEDGGATWQDVSLPEDVVLYGIKMVNAKAGWMVGEFGRILKTSDGGRTWQDMPMVVGQSLFCIAADGNHIVAAGLDGQVVYSKDSGKTFLRGINPLKKSLYGMAVHGRECWAVGDPGILVRSTDGGKTWGFAQTSERPSIAWDRRGQSFFTSMQD